MFPLIITYIQFLFGELLFVWKTPKRKRAFINVLFAVALSFALILILFFLQSNIVFYGWELVNKIYSVCFFIVIWCCSMLVIHCLVELSFKSLLFIGLVSYIQQHLAYALEEAFVQLVPMSHTVHGISMFVAPFLLMILLYPLILWNRKVYEHADKQHLILGVLVLFVCVFMNSFSYNGGISTRIYDIFCCICCYLLLYSESSKKFIRDNNEFLQIMMAKEHEQHALSRQAVQMMNVKIHDLKHQIDNLQQCVDGVEKLNYEGFKELRHTVAIFVSMMNTGNETLDSVVMEKALICEINKVHFSCIADGKSLSFMEAIDVFSLFNNLLDNAVESQLKEAEIEKRYVSLCIERKLNMLLVYIENYCTQEVKDKNGIIATTKENKENHGLGMKGINHVVEKYGGEMNVEWKDFVFSVGIIFNV